MEQLLNVINRKECKITNVSEIVNFNRKEIIIAFADETMLMIKGKNMEIVSFSGDYLHIAGKLDSFTYSE